MYIEDMSKQLTYDNTPKICSCLSNLVNLKYSPHLREALYIVLFYSCIFAASPSFSHSCFIVFLKSAYFLYICMQMKEGSLYWCHFSLQLVVNGIC